MQKFTRALTREIELAGERLALTLDATGISVRPVGSRKPPRELTWAAVVCQLAGGAAEPPSAEALAQAMQALKGGAAAKPAPKKPEPDSAGVSPSPAEAVPSLWQRLETWLAQHRKRYLDGLAPGASPAELDALQTALGLPLPADLRVWLARHNGQSRNFVGYFVGSWSLMSTEQIATAKRELDETAGETESGWRKEWVPFLEDDNGDYVCLDTSLRHAPVREFWLGRSEHPIVAASLTAWLADLVGDVERGEYIEDPERGVFLRSPRS